MSLKALKEKAQKYFPQCCSMVPLHGGDISATYLLENVSGEKRVLKLHQKVRSVLEVPKVKNLFVKEVEALFALDKVGVLPVPKVFSFDEDHILMAYLPPVPSPPNPIFWKKLGLQLAEMHQKAQTSFFGFQDSNFIGGSVQKNSLLKDDGKSTWADFFIQYRLDAQMEQLQSSKNLFASQVIPDIPALLKVYREKRNFLWDILSKAQKKERFRPTLLHGDLWSGNILFCAEDNLVYLIDPAVYYGHWEADLAMTKLFGMFPKIFYESYYSIQPLAFDWEKRELIYQLYHLFNHLNLFGEIYLPQCLSLLGKIK